MKTIKNIDEVVEHFDKDLEKQFNIQPQTYRKMFKSAIGIGLTKNAEEAIDLIQIGLKLKIDSSDIVLEDVEFKMLKERCELNFPQWGAHFHGMVLLKLRESAG